MLKPRGSVGLKRMAREMPSIAGSYSPRKALPQPLNSQAQAKLGVSAIARSIRRLALSWVPTTKDRAIPAVHRATASSLPNSAARLARRAASATSISRFAIQALPFRWEIDPRCHAICGSKAGIDFDGLVEIGQRFLAAFLGP